MSKQMITLDLFDILARLKERVSFFEGRHAALVEALGPNTSQGVGNAAQELKEAAKAMRNIEVEVSVADPPRNVENRFVEAPKTFVEAPGATGRPPAAPGQPPPDNPSNQPPNTRPQAEVTSAKVKV